MNATVNNSHPLRSSNNRTDIFIDEPLASFYVRAFLFALIMLGSTLGNAVVCRAILSLPTRHRLFSYYLVTNLAVAEAISSLCLPFYFVYDWLKHWPFGDVACKLVFPVQMTAMFVVTYTLAFIAAYRYRVIVSSCRQSTSCSLAKVLLMFGLLWGAALIIVLPVGVMHAEIKLPSGQNLCIALFPGDTLEYAPRHTKYSIVRLILSFVFPYLVISISYIAVALKIKTHVAESNAKRTNRENSEDVPPQNALAQFIELEEMEGNACMQKENGKKTKAKRVIGKAGCPRHALRPVSGVRRTTDGSSSVMNLELDILRMIYLIILTFIVCYIPVQVAFIYEEVKGGLSDWPYYTIVRRYAFLLTCLPGAFHPILYGTMSTFYAKVFATLVSCHTK